MIVDETRQVEQSIEDIPRNNCFKIPRATMLRYSSSVNTKIYALHLKQKSNAGVFHGILRNFRTATF